MLGAVFGATNRSLESLNAFERAVQLEPSDPASLFNLCIALQDLNKLDESETICRKLIKIKPDFAEAHNNLANLFSYLNNNEAEYHYNKTIELIPNEIYPRLNMSNYLIKNNRFDESLKHLKEILDMGLESKEVYNSLGVSYKGLDDDDNAKKMFQKSLGLDPNFTLAQKNLDSLD